MLDRQSQVPPPKAPLPLESLERDRRQAFLLHLLASAPGRRLPRGQATRKLQTKAARASGLNGAGAGEQFRSLQADGLVRIVTAKRTTIFELTDAGAARLTQLKELIPPQPTRGAVKAPANEQVRGLRTSYLLLQVLRGKNGTMTEVEANKSLDSYAREGLELNAPTASQLRRELAAAGLLTVQGNGRGAAYALTPEGRLALGNARFEESRDFRLPGEVLNRLLEAAREVGKQFTAVPPAAGGVPTRAELEEAILESFGELRRERHAVSGLVPIAEVRAAVRRRFGEAAARHDCFDEAVLALWRAHKLGLVPITDPSQAAPGQLQDAIPGQGDILFYLETAHEPAAL
jgi:predicted transcriptional regulator